MCRSSSKIHWSRLISSFWDFKHFRASISKRSATPTSWSANQDKNTQAYTLKLYWNMFRNDAVLTPFVLEPVTFPLFAHTQLHTQHLRRGCRANLNVSTTGNCLRRSSTACVCVRVTPHQHCSHTLVIREADDDIFTAQRSKEKNLIVSRAAPQNN